MSPLTTIRPPAGFGLAARRHSRLDFTFWFSATMVWLSLTTMLLPAGCWETSTLDSAGTVTLPLPVGSVTSTIAECRAGGLSGAQCYELTVDCPAIDEAGVTVKYHPATGEPRGTVIFTTGGGGRSLYEEAFTFGPDLLEDLHSAGFATAQVSWDRSWNEGPGGFERLGCRYATVASWIHDNLHQGGESQALCATGNSGGSAQIAYAMTRYGLGDRFDAIVPTSGPPLGRMDLGCDCDPETDVAEVPCGNDSLCYDEGSLSTIDEAYSGSPCQDRTDIDTLAADSVVAPGVLLDYPTTKVIVVFGGEDSTNSVAQGMQWYNAITSEVEVLCVPEAGHNVPSHQEGYETIRDELLAECVLQPPVDPSMDGTSSPP